jgi:hypothetical protein
MNYKSPSPPQTTKHKVKYVNKITFPNPNLFCEGYSTPTNNIILLPLNSKTKTENGQGLYKYYIDSNLFVLLFSYKPNEICFNAIAINDDEYVLNFVKTNELRIYKHKNIIKQLYLEGLPNHMCINNNDKRVYIAIMRTFPATSGCVCELNLSNYKLRYLIGETFCGYTTSYNDKISLSMPTGIATLNGYVYVATLINIIRFNISDPTDAVIIMKSSDFPEYYPFFDNITIYKDTLYVAIFDYGKYVNAILNFALTNNTLLNIYYIIGYLTNTTFVGDTEPDLSHMIPDTYIHYVKINTSTNIVKYKILDTSIQDFDKMVTQIGRIDRDMYCMVNYKAGIMILTSK